MKRQTRDKSLRKGNSLEKNEWDKAERLTWQLLKSHEKVAMKCKNAVCLQGIIWCHCFTLTIHQHSFNLLHFYAHKQLHTGKGREGNMKLQYAPQTEHFAIGCLNNQCTTISFFITPYIWVCSQDWKTKEQCCEKYVQLEQQLCGCAKILSLEEERKGREK